MDDLKRMSVFATVVAQGSMSAAARVLNMSPSAVSQHIRALEAEAGVRLLNRSTRQLSLTDIGQRVYAQCATLQGAAERARSELMAERQTPSGELRMAAPLGFARHAAPALGQWLAEHPALRLQLLVDDAPTDLVQARIDLALRFGALRDTSWVARHLGRTPNVLCASPSWLHAWGTSAQAVPHHPNELLHAAWLDMSHASGEASHFVWSHAASGEQLRFEVLPRMRCSQRSAVQSLCEAGLGLAVLSAMDVTEALRERKLVQLLPDWDMGHLDLWALTAQRTALPAKVRQAIDALQHYFAHLHGVQSDVPRPL